MHFKITHTEILEKKAERSPKEPYFKGKISGKKIKVRWKNINHTPKIYTLDSELSILYQIVILPRKFYWFEHLLTSVNNFIVCQGSLAHNSICICSQTPNFCQLLLNNPLLHCHLRLEIADTGIVIWMCWRDICSWLIGNVQLSMRLP